MLLRLPVTHLRASPGAAPSYGFSSGGEFCRFGYCARNFAHPYKPGFKLVGQSLGDRWKLNDINASELFFLFANLFNFVCCYIVGYY